jgi:hypothetical protein
MLFSGVTIAGFAWHWNQPKAYANGFSYSQSVPILLIASILVNGIAYHFQNQYTRTQLQQPRVATTFRPFLFALRFYFYQLATAVVLSLLGFLPLLTLLFFYWIYPIAFWLMPYAFVIGLILGWDIQNRLQPYAAESREGRG